MDSDEFNANNFGTGWQGDGICEKCKKPIKIPGGAFNNVNSGKVKASEFCRKCKPTK